MRRLSSCSLQVVMLMLEKEYRRGHPSSAGDERGTMTKTVLHNESDEGASAGRDRVSARSRPARTLLIESELIKSEIPADSCREAARKHSGQSKSVEYTPGRRLKQNVQRRNLVILECITGLATETPQTQRTRMTGYRKTFFFFFFSVALWLCG